MRVDLVDALAVAEAENGQYEIFEITEVLCANQIADAAVELEVGSGQQVTEEILSEAGLGVVRRSMRNAWDFAGGDRVSACVKNQGRAL
jgi:hypothetical protein